MVRPEGLYDGHGEIFYEFPNLPRLSQTGWILGQTSFSPPLFPLYVSHTLLPSPLALSATRQKTSTVVKESDIETETLRVSQVPIPSLSLCCLPGTPPRLFLCPVSSTARQRYASTLPCAQLRAVQCADVHTIYCPHQIGSLLWCFVQASHLLFSTFSHKRLNIQRLGEREKGGSGSWFKEQIKPGRAEWDRKIKEKGWWLIWEEETVLYFCSKSFSYVHISVKSPPLLLLLENRAWKS